jgi:hypothetical protein
MKSTILKRHWGVVILATMVGLAILLPTVLSINKIGLENFKGIYPMFNDDEDYYLTLTKEVYDGHISLSNPYIQEYKEGTYLFPPVPEITYSTFAKLFGIAIVTVSVINDFLLPFISVLLLYFLFFKTTQSSKKIALLLTSIFFIFFINTFSRPISPQFGFIFLLIGLNLIWIISTNKHDIKKIFLYNLGLGVVFGILVYSYPFYWMTLGVVYTLWTFVIYFIDKDFKYWFKNWLAFFVPALVFFVPFIINTLTLRENPLFIETNLRMGFINTHIPGAFFNVGLIFLCIPLAYVLLFICKNKSTAFFSPILILSGIILNWQNIITGQTLQFPPHFYLVMVLFTFLIVSIFLSNTKKDFDGNYSYKIKISLLIIFCILFLILHKQKGEIIYSWKNIYSPVDIADLQKAAEPLNWLEKNTPKDSTLFVLAKNYDWMIPIYTDNNVYFNTNAGLSMMSDVELEKRWVIQHFFDSVSSKEIYGNREIWTNKFIEKYKSTESRRKILQFITNNKYPETILMDSLYVDRVIKSYEEFRSMGFEKAIKTYAVDYIIIDKSYKQYDTLVDRFKNYHFLTPTVQFGDTLIYKVN